MKVFLLTLLVAFAAAAPIDDSGDAVEVIVNGVAEGEALEIGHIVGIALQEHVDGELAASSDLLHPFTAVGIAEAALAAEELEPVQVIEETEVSPIDIVPEVVLDPIELPESAAPEVVPEPVVLPEAAVPEVVPEAVVLPEAAVPEVVPEPVVLPEPVIPEVVPEPVVLPEPVSPEVAPEPVVLPEPVNPEVVPEPVVPEVVLPEPVVPEVIEEVAPEVPELPTGEVYNDGLVQVIVNTPEDTGIIATLQSWVSMVLNFFDDGAQTTQQIL